MHDQQNDHYSITDEFSNDKPIFKKLNLRKLKSQTSKHKYERHNFSKRICDAITFQISSLENTDKEVCYSIFSHLTDENKRKDFYGIPIIKGSKKHKVSFNISNFEEIHLIESFKEFNFSDKLKDENQIITNEIKISKETVKCQCCSCLIL